MEIHSMRGMQIMVLTDNWIDVNGQLWLPSSYCALLTADLSTCAPVTPICSPPWHNLFIIDIICTSELLSALEMGALTKWSTPGRSLWQKMDSNTLAKYIDCLQILCSLCTLFCSLIFLLIFCTTSSASWVHHAIQISFVLQTNACWSRRLH